MTRFLPARGNLVVPLVGGYLAFCFIYLGAGHFHLASPRTLTPTAIDRAIPFLDWSVLVYLTQFLILPAGLIGARGDRERGRAFAAMMIASLVSGVIFLAVPTRIPREALVFAEGPLREVWRALFSLDPDTNCFPSLHVALAILAAWAMDRNGRVTAVLFGAWALSITASTLTTKQHLLVDVLGGAVVAVSAARVARRLVP